MKPSDELLAAVLKERQRQFDLPGTEHDVIKGPNDWVAMVASYLTEVSVRSGIPPTQAEFEKSFIKAMAVALAALQHSDLMLSRHSLR